VHLAAIEWRAGTKQRHFAPWFLRLQDLSHRPCCSTLSSSDVDIDNGHIFNAGADLDNEHVCNTDANVDPNHSHVNNGDADVDNNDNNGAGPDELFRGDNSASKHVDEDDDSDAGPDELFRGDNSAAKHIDDDDDNDAGTDELRRGDRSGAKHVDDDADDDGANDHSTDDEQARGWCAGLGGPVESSAGVIERRWPFRRGYLMGPCILSSCASRPFVSVNIAMI